MNSETVLILAFLGIIAFLFFCIQRKVFNSTQHIVFKIMPVLILIGIFICVYVTYKLKVSEITSREIYTSMALADAEIFFNLFAVILITALAGCIAGLSAQLIYNKVKKGKTVQ